MQQIGELDATSHPPLNGIAVVKILWQQLEKFLKLINI
jgi:hypothetical protein